MKKIVSMMVLICLMAVGLLACQGKSTTVSNETVTSSNETKNEQGNNEASNDEKVKITYWHTHNETTEDGFNYMLEEFNKKYPNIEVEHVFQGNYGDLSKKITASLAAGDTPDVALIESALLPNFAESEVFEDLQPYFEKDAVDVADFSKGMLDAYKYKGTQYAVPFMVSASVFVYNQELFDEAGITPPQTWDELEEYAEKMTIKDGDTTTQYAFAVPGWSSWYYDPWIVNAGGSVLDENGNANISSEKSKKFLKKFQEWKDKGQMFLPYGKGSSGTMRQMFFDKEIAMVEHTSHLIDWYEENADFEVGVSFLPGDEKRTTMIGGAGITMLSNIPDERKEAAWKFIEFMTSSEHNIAFNDATGYIPTRKSAVASKEGQKFLEENHGYKAIIEQFDNVNPRVQHPAYGEFSSVYKNVVGKIALEGGDVDQLMEDANKEINEILADY
ncbi:ABC transporter substrate-binding protein [Alkalihalobacillus sp. BA299]|uniref:ABC transporter substrate-binding protein n=1 Tax=Alkalihalobacillus sp. BA299 TaxID=2815938 RepID=UPI0027DE69D1|nr:ABC transporter substrate-binding protein [Alkalihalobacillus sp. BA299]